MDRASESAEAVGLSTSRLERIRPAMQHYVDSRGYSGLSTMIARRGRVVHFEQIGWQDRELRKPLAADTIFRLYSMTKPVICAALMTLYEEGRFQLWDPVAKYIRAFARLRVFDADAAGPREQALARPVLIRDLLTHTSGLTYDFLEDSPVSGLYREARLMHNAGRRLEDLVHELARLPLAYQPGTRWQYSYGIDVAAHLIELLADAPLAHVLETRLFAPLGMVDTGFAVPAAKRGRLATMYGLPDIAAPDMTLSRLVEAWGQRFNEQIDVSASYPADAPDTFARGGHGLFSTAGDYMRFAQMLLNQGALDGARILSRKTLALMHTNHIDPALLPYEVGGMPTAGYGFGLGSRVLLNLAESALPGSVGEFGWSGAAKTYFWVDPQEELVGLLMAQAMSSFDQPEKKFQLLTYQAFID